MQLIPSLAIVVGTWIYVPGGAWQPDQSEVSDARVKLRPYVVAQAKARGDDLPAWRSYTFQYQGRELEGRKVIYVNAFCSTPPDDVERNMVMTLDGGTCFFQAYYDIEIGEYIRIFFNGVA